MKKAIALIIALLMMAGMCACNVTVSSPDETVDDFLSAMKKGDQETLMLYVENNDVNTLLNNTMADEVKKEIYNDIMSNLTWEITSVETNEEQTEAVVNVEVTNADFSGVLKTYKSKAVKYMEKNLYDKDVTKEVMRKECVNIFAEVVKEASDKKEDLVTVPLEIKLTKNDSYGWDMEMKKEITKAAIGGLKWPN